MPEISASCELSFSSMKRIKTYIRSSMGEDRLTALAVLYIHRSSVTVVDIEKVIQHFFLYRESEYAVPLTKLQLCNWIAICCQNCIYVKNVLNKTTSLILKTIMRTNTSAPTTALFPELGVGMTPDLLKYACTSLEGSLCPCNCDTMLATS